MGPNFWNLHFDELLRMLEEYTLDVDIIAYADDLLVLVKTNSRSALERLGQLIMDLV